MSFSHPGNPNDDLDACRFHVFLDTTTQCNLRCRHCWHDAVRSQGYKLSRQIMSRELFEKICRQFSGRCRSFALSCGFEPLLNDALVDCIAHAVEAGLPDVHFYTNGVLLSEEKAESIVAARPSRIVFSLEGVDEATYGDIRRGARLGDLSAALSHVNVSKARAQCERPELELNWVLMPRNLDQLPALADFAVRSQVARVTLTPHVRWADASLSEPSLAEIDRGRLRDAVDGFVERCAVAGVEVIDAMVNDLFPPEGAAHSLANACRRVGRSLTPWRRRAPDCMQPWELIAINPSGRVTPCFGELSDEAPGDFSTQTLEEIWRSEAYCALRAGLKREAPALDHCQRCWLYRKRDGRISLDTYFRPRPMDVERLRRVMPSIVRAQDDE